MVDDNNIDNKKVIKVYLHGGVVEIENPTEVEVELHDFDIDGTEDNLKTKKDGEQYVLTNWWGEGWLIWVKKLRKVLSV